MTVDELIQHSTTLIQWIDARVGGLETPNDPRIRYAGGSFQVVSEHHKGTVTLIKNLHYTTARTVIRPIFEAHVRGLWLLHCATQREIDRYEKHDIDKTFAALLDAVEVVDGFDSKILTAIKVRYWKAMNAYVHTGFQQVVRHQTEDSIEPVNDPEEAKDMLVFANLMGCMATVSIAGLAKNSTLANDVVEQMEKVWSPTAANHGSLDADV